jgi:deoxyribodipyrimidine photo-lyase
LVEPQKLEAQSGAHKFYENDYSYFDSLPKNRFWIGGKSAALSKLKEFLDEKLDGYAAYRNDPTKNYQSELSPYLHFGQISSLEMALAVSKTKANEESKASFLEELIVRRELADNFCLYCTDYDNENSLEPWAKANMVITDNEPREYVYSLEEFESAKTHDELWNAAQTELKTKGKIHGYMRMYWAKKILEWTPSTKEAFRVAVYLNDRYAIDGRDPNGYAGIAWSLGGVHDRAWPSRKIFGKVRYMNYNGCKAKFDVKGYIMKINRSYSCLL